MVTHKLFVLGTLAALTVVSLADSNDFVNPRYIATAKDDPGTRHARSTIVRSGNTSAKKGPWSVTDTDIRAATGDPRDYLSWAPYHWPNCNWCGQTNSVNNGRNQDAQEQRVRMEDRVNSDNPGKQRSLDDPLVTTHNRSTSLFARLKRQAGYLDPFQVVPDSSLASGLLDMMGNLFDRFVEVEWKELGAAEVPSPDTEANISEKVKAMELEIGQLATTLTMDETSPISTASSLMEASAAGFRAAEDPTGNLLAARGLAPATLTHIVQTPITVPPTPPTVSSSSTRSPSGPEEFPLRAHKSTKTKSCTTSPTTSMPPSATWTTCPYKPRDGRVNPDVRDLRSGGYFNEMSQSVFWNAIAAIVSGSTAPAKQAVAFIDTFFLDRNTKMNPNVEFGQIVRGPPGTQSGSYMGILDLRALVKVVNAILVFRESEHPDWTQDRDVKMRAWAAQYIQWIETSVVGKKAQRAANNHGSFYPNQIAALKIFGGDIAGARLVLQSYFDNQFQDQIVASGEQPLEAVRTRPFHYRCFNLEAMITNAKLGDYIGMNFWDFRTKYGATIQTAVDYLMTLDPGSERLEEALPHVAAAAAVYGDPHDKYAAYLKSGNQNYIKKPFWFYDQPGAITRGLNAQQGSHDGFTSAASHSQTPTPTNSEDPPEAQAANIDQNHPPSMFANGQLVELEEGLFVGWEDVREFYKKETRETSYPMTPAGPRKEVVTSTRTEPPPSMLQEGKEVELEDELDVD